MEQKTDTVAVYCRNTGAYCNVRIGATLLEVYQAAGQPLRCQPLCARVNNRVLGLLYRCWEPADVEFLDYTEQSGARTYLRTLCFILFKVVHDLFPDKHLNLEHPVSKGYYCKFIEQVEITDETVAQIKRRMQEIIDADLTFTRRTARSSEAVGLFRERGMLDKALLLETSGMAYSSYYELDGYIDYFYGCLAPSSGYIRLFDLVAFSDPSVIARNEAISPRATGLLLRVPQQDTPSELCPFVPQPKLFDAYKRHLALQDMLGVNNVGDLNAVIKQGGAAELIMVCEAMQEKHIARIASNIAEKYRAGGARIVLISGPSSSGKTTFCKRLQIQLKTNLLFPLGISLDDYYLNREDTPLDEEGNYDFESLYAIDLPYFKSDLQKLTAGEEIELPEFNFETGKREYHGKKIRLKDNSVIVLEGIHGLNPELTDTLAPEQLFKVYVSALTTISLDGHNYIPTTDNRMLRRIVRDYQFRGYSAKQTISMWKSVRRGEDKWIFPYQENADETFNSAMIYELAALRRFAEPILSEVPETDVEHAEAYRLLKFLRYFKHISASELPGASLLREFLGK